MDYFTKILKIKSQNTCGIFCYRRRVLLYYIVVLSQLNESKSKVNLLQMRSL